jgi:hypothetical protein
MKMLDARQQAKLNSYDVVDTHFSDNAFIINSNTAFKNTVNEVKPIIANLKAAARQSGAVTAGITEGKNNLKQTLSQKAAKIAGLIYAYAAKNGNPELKAAVDFSPSELSRLKDGELAPRSQTIHDAGVANLAALADYGVTDEKLADLQTAITAYSQTAPQPRAAIADRSVVKANIKQLFAAIDKIFTEQLDRLIEDFAETHPDFVAGYKAKRKIVDPKTKSAPPPSVTGSGGITPA